MPCKNLNILPSFIHALIYVFIHSSIHSRSHETHIDLLPRPGHGDTEVGTAWFYTQEAQIGATEILLEREMGADMIFRKYVGQSTVGANGSQFPDGKKKAVDKNQRKSDCISRRQGEFSNN